MPTTFRPYQPDQGLLLPSDLEGLAASWALGAPCERSGGRIGLDGVLRAVRGRRSAQVAVRAADDGEGSDLRVRDGGVFLARVGTEAGGGRGLSGSGSGELSEPPDDLRVSAASSWGFQAVVRGSGAVGGGDRRGELRQVVDRRDEGSGERLKRKAMSYGRMLEEERRLQAEIEALLDRAGAVDAQEDARFGEDFEGTSCRRSCAGGRTVWRRSGRRRNVWRLGSARPMRLAGASRE